MNKPSQVKAMTAEAIMTENPIVVHGNQTVKEVIELFLEKNISGAPMVDANGHLISVVSESDLMKLAISDGMEKMLGTLTEKLVKVKDVIVVRRTDPFVQVFKQFLTQPIRRVIVIDGADRVLGVVSRKNILRAYMETVKANAESSGEEQKK